MFTGIIHKTARVFSISRTSAGRRLILDAPWTDHVLGESTAINGTCLTVAAILDEESSPTRSALAYDVIPETIQKTNLDSLKPGDIVHIERSLRVGDPVDGHFVQGHVDGVGRLMEQITTGGEWRMRIEIPPALATYFIPKGSIAIDGVSLTLASVQPGFFDVALIPTTLELTRLGTHSIGYAFNLECDSMAKTIVSYLERIRPEVDHGGSENRKRV